MNQSDFKDKHKGETMICIGNGPSLRNIPPAFLESATNIGLNYISKYMAFLKLDYWLTLDKECLDAMPDDVPSFAPYRYKNLIQNQNYVPMILNEEIEMLPYSPLYGVSYTTSLAAATHLAVYMGASRVFVVGFDCSFPWDPLGDHEEGMSNLAHFYDYENKRVTYYQPWDVEMKLVSDFAYRQGIEVFNLSEPTLSYLLVQDRYDRHWEPAKHKLLPTVVTKGD